MNKKLVIYFSFIVFSFSLIGCLTFDSKEYTFKVKKDGSGSGKIVWSNIIATVDSASKIEDDYTQLITDYYKGDKLLQDLPSVKNVKKRLYEEDNQLCGEVSFDFEDISKLKFYKYKDVLCYYLPPTNFLNMGAPTESYFNSNGTFGGETMPIVFWDDSVKEINIKTTVKNTGKTESLLEMWKQKGDK